MRHPSKPLVIEKYLSNPHKLIEQTIVKPPDDSCWIAKYYNSRAVIITSVRLCQKKNLKFKCKDLAHGEVGEEITLPSSFFMLS